MMNLFKRIMYINELKENRNSFHKTVRTVAKKIDDSFAMPSDVGLTPEEKDAVDAYWSRYRFAYPKIDYKSFATFKNRYGQFDVRHCPGPIRSKYFYQYFNTEGYMGALQNKCLLNKLFPGIKTPMNVVRYMRGFFYDKNYVWIKKSTAYRICMEELSKGNSLIFKPSNVGGGRGVTIIDAGSDSADMIIKSCLDNPHAAFVIQRLIKQNEFLNAFNDSSFNTIRITSLLYKGKVHVLAGLIRIGQPGSRIDNFSQGGCILGFDINTGKCNKWALTKKNERITELPSGLDLTQDFFVPNIDQLKKTVRKLHVQIPYLRLVSWDIGIDDSEEFTLIENNAMGMIQIHEAVTGPIFGELLDDLLDDYLLKKFYYTGANLSYTYREYDDHVEIESYDGKAVKVRVPDKIKGKPVTRILPNAFGNRIKKVIVSRTISEQSESVLLGVKKVDLI